MIKDARFGEKKLLGAFGILILLTIAIGTIGISQIQELSYRIDKLGKHNLKLEKAILEMRINSAAYSAGIRNYVFWRVSHYLGALPMAVNLNNVFEAGERFKQQLRVYKNNTYSLRQKEWANQITVFFIELTGLGKQIADLINSEQGVESEERVKNLLMVFENRLYRIDKFLDDTVSKDNLNEIEQQLIKTESDKRSAILVLTSTLIGVVIISSFIAIAVYSHRKKDRIYRQQLINQMINLEENERKNISAEIHDQLGQDLSALKIYLGIIEGNLTNLTDDLKEKFQQCKRIVSDLISKSHNIAFLLRPPALDEVGLVESIEALFLEYKHLAGINYVYQKPKEELKLPSEHSLLFYRISQELLTNMLKHSRAKNVFLRIDKDKNSVEYVYEDDGIGFQYQEISGKPQRRREDKFKLGLLGLKERVELLDGSMQIEATPEKGTKITVQLNI